jgi:hypothetical protein
VQKIAEAMFKETKLMKDIDLDKDAVHAYIDKEIKDASWKTAMKATTEECLKDVAEQKDKIIGELEKAPFNIKKDQCNVLPMSMVTCIHLEGFVVSQRSVLFQFNHNQLSRQRCPKEAWTEEKRCTDAKIWIEKCGHEIDSLRQLMMVQD